MTSINSYRLLGLEHLK